DTVERLPREHRFEVGANLLAADEHDPYAVHPPHAAIERVGDAAQVAVDDRLDVPLVPPLRPAALVVTPRHVVALVGELDQAPGFEPEQPAALPTDDGDDCALPTADERNQRREVELRADLDHVDDRPRGRQRGPE